jgi:hypothetical protein
MSGAFEGDGAGGVGAVWARGGSVCESRQFAPAHLPRILAIGIVSGLRQVFTELRGASAAFD